MSTHVRMTFEMVVGDGDDEDCLGDLLCELETLFQLYGGDADTLKTRAEAEGIEVTMTVDRGDFSASGEA